MTNLKADEKILTSIQINVENLVEFMLDQLTSTEWIKKAPLVANSKCKYKNWFSSLDGQSTIDFWFSWLALCWTS